MILFSVPKRQFGTKRKKPHCSESAKTLNAPVSPLKTHQKKDNAANNTEHTQDSLYGLLFCLWPGARLL